MSTHAIQQEALARATGGQATSNYADIFRGFLDKGIPETDIRPRINVLTFNAWRALGRFVRKGEHGVHVLTWIPVHEQKDADGNVTRRAGKRPKGATVFHVSQTSEIGATAPA